MADKTPEIKSIIVESRLVPITELKPAVYNPRKIHPAKYKALKKSIEQNGVLDPIIVNKRTGNTVVGGHQRLRAVTELGLEDIPVNFIDVDEAQEKVLNLGLNNITGENDKDKVAKLMVDLLGFDNIDLSMTGFNMDEIAGMTNTKEEDVDDPEYPITPYFGEKYNYVVIFTKNEVDWTYLRNALGIEAMKSYKSTAVGTSHVITFEQFEQKWNERSS